MGGEGGNREKHNKQSLWVGGEGVIGRNITNRHCGWVGRGVIGRNITNRFVGGVGGLMLYNTRLLFCNLYGNQMVTSEMGYTCNFMRALLTF